MSGHTKEPYLYTTKIKPEHGQSVIVLVADGSGIYTGVYTCFGSEHRPEVINDMLGHNSVFFDEYDLWMLWPESLKEPDINQCKLDYDDELHTITKRNTELLEALKEYGEHSDTCIHATHMDCTCGLDKAIESAEVVV